MKKQSDFSRLMGYAGRYRVFTYASWVLSAISALVALVPFLYIWMILRDVLAAAPDYAQAVNIPHYGWMAVLFAVLAYLIYIAALMCSHLSAFRVATNLRLAVSEHLALLPLGFAENFGSGKLRKIIHESTGAAETYLAHQLPDQYNAIATPVGLLVLLLAFDWRLGLLSLAPVVLAFLIMATMTGKQMVEKMRQYGNALESMSNEAVEYVRGIPVVKTFGQSVFSFKKFKTAIDEYEKWVVSYTKDLRLPMMFYTAAVNGVFAFLIAGGLLFTAHGVTPEFLLNLLFYIIITPVISLTLTRIMYIHYIKKSAHIITSCHTAVKRQHKAEQDSQRERPPVGLRHKRQRFFAELRELVFQVVVQGTVHIGQVVFYLVDAICEVIRNFTVQFTSIAQKCRIRGRVGRTCGRIGGRIVGKDGGHGAKCSAKHEAQRNTKSFPHYKKLLTNLIIANSRSTSTQMCIVVTRPAGRNGNTYE